MFLIDKEGAVAEEFDLPISKSCIWTESNSQDNHIYIEAFFIGYKAFYLTISFNCLNSLSKSQTDVVVFQVFRHDVCKVFVIVAIQDSVHDIHQDNIFTKTFKSFSKFNTNVTTTNDGDTIYTLASGKLGAQASAAVPLDLLGMLAVRALQTAIVNGAKTAKTSHGIPGAAK